MCRALENEGARSLASAARPLSTHAAIISRKFVGDIHCLYSWSLPHMAIWIMDHRPSVFVRTKARSYRGGRNDVADVCPARRIYSSRERLDFTTPPHSLGKVPRQGEGDAHEEQLCWGMTNRPCLEIIFSRFFILFRSFFLSGRGHFAN